MKTVKTILVLGVLLIVLLIACSCNLSESLKEFGEMPEPYEFEEDIEKIDDCLVYYKDTKVVYIMHEKHVSASSLTYTFFAPYISENGKYCRYIDGNIVEIN